MTLGILRPLRRVCSALPTSRYDEAYRSLTRLQRLLVMAFTIVVVLVVPPRVADDGVTSVGLAVGLLTFYGLVSLLARFGSG